MPGFTEALNDANLHGYYNAIPSSITALVMPISDI